jgi:hypothetical protein
MEDETMNDHEAIRNSLLRIGHAFAKHEDGAAHARVVAQAMTELELTREMKLCLLDFVIECNPRKGEYEIPSKELIAWAYRIIRRWEAGEETA